MGTDAYLKAPLTTLKGIGEKTAKLFHACQVDTVEDLLRYYPRDYEIFEEIRGSDRCTQDTVVSVSGVVAGAPLVRRVRARTILSCVVDDGHGRMQAVWFNAPYLKNTLKEGHNYVFRGLLRKKNGTLQLVQPRFFSPGDYALLAGTMQPRYPLTKGLTNATVMKAVKGALSLACYERETIPEEILQKEGLYGIKKALCTIHFPESREAYLEARKRLSFEEFYHFILRLRALREENETQKNDFPCIEPAQCRRLIEALPYTLTGAQRRVFDEICADLSGKRQMHRLLQGDVGSGKTIVAFLALLMCACNGYQGAIMAPTSVLAVQHFESFCALAARYELPVKPVLLTGALSAKERKKAVEAIEEGSCNVVVGTHALFQEAVSYKNLALVITDEQHRFGVRQREALSDKAHAALHPHVLSMSATPIPRTLAIILYGDLDVSLLDEAPAARKSIKNAVVDTGYRKTAWKMIVKEVRKGRQAYVVCPMIEPGEMEGAQNVTEYADMLREQLPGSVRIGVLHGRMKPKDKDRVMEEFSTHLTDVLVTTTVVEVGVDVPNATVMMIEDAQCFGLAQLHQLRGRVGRGEAQSYCIFVDTSAQAGQGQVSERLSVMKESNDGFHIAEEDLRLRGPGELFGLRQSGALAFRIADIYRDADLLTRAASYVSSTPDAG